MKFQEIKMDEEKQSIRETEIKKTQILKNSEKYWGEKIKKMELHNINA